MIYRFLGDYFVRSLQASDLDGPYRSWFENQKVTKYNSHGKFFKTKDYYAAFFQSLNDSDKIVWAICHDDDGHIGNISLQDISLINRSAEFAIILGDEKHWGKKVSLEAGKLLLFHGFFKLNLEKIYCGTASNNLGMNKLALALGMTQEGCRRNHLYLEGDWLDMIEYGILRKEFEKKYKEEFSK